MGGHPSKTIAEGADAAPHAHPRRSATSPPRSAAEGSAAASDAKRQRERPTGGTNTTKGAAGGRSDVARNEPPSAGRKTSDRPPNHPRASDGAMPAGALSFATAKPHFAPSAGSVTERSIAGQPGSRRFARQRCSARTSDGCPPLARCATPAPAFGHFQPNAC